MGTGRVVQHVSDTAHWAAVYRARETERADAVFRDPFARRLAGERGEEIAKAFPFHEKNAWSWVARTYAFDGIIREQLAQGVDLVVNLAAGLDARPYRMDLPSSVRWLEVDLPEILDYKGQFGERSLRHPSYIFQCRQFVQFYGRFPLSRCSLRRWQSSVTMHQCRPV